MADDEYVCDYCGNQFADGDKVMTVSESLVLVRDGNVGESKKREMARIHKTSCFDKFRNIRE